MHSGWTVWERVVLYNSIYAVKHHMIPVVDMKNYTNIYMEDDELHIANTWTKFYEQPAGIDLEVAYNSNNYILCDPRIEWFQYIRSYDDRLMKDTEFLRQEFKKYIRLKKPIISQLQSNIAEIIPDYSDRTRMLGLCLRGTDYKTHHHMVQPEVLTIIEEVKRAYNELRCSHIFLATEDAQIFSELIKDLKGFPVVSWNAGKVCETSVEGGYIGEYLKKTASPTKNAIDYLTVLYGLDCCVGLIGGLCGATIVAQYRKLLPYEYINIIDLHASY